MDTDEHVGEALLRSQRLLFGYERLLHADPPEDLACIASAHQRHASLLVRAGLGQAAELHSARALALAESEGATVRAADVRREHERVQGRVKAAERAVAVDDELTDSGRAVAEGLHTQVLDLLKADRDEEALAVSADEIAAWRELRNRYGGQHVYLADAFDNRAVALSRLRRYEEALEYSERAVLLYELLSQVDGGHRGKLAGALFNEHASLAGLGAPAKALACTRRLVRLYDRLDGEHATDRAEAHRLHALNLSKVGDHEAARTAIEATLALIERTLGVRTPEYADALTAHVVIGRASGIPKTEQLILSAKALALEELVGGRVSELVSALRNHVISLDRAGRVRDAIEFGARAIALCEDPEVLAECLDQHAVHLKELGRHAEALEHSTRSVAIYTRLLDTDRGRYLLDAGKARDNHAGHFESLGRFDEAVEQSVTAMAMLEEADAEAADPDSLGIALGNFANRLVGAGRAQEALEVSERTLLVREKVAEGDPAARAGLAMALVQRAWVLGKNSEQEAALPILERALALYAELPADDNETVAVLAQAVQNQASFFNDLERFEEATTASRRAVELREGLAAGDEELYLPALAVSLEWAELYHHRAGLWERFETYARRFLVLADRLGITTERPGDVSDIVHRLAQRLSDTGREAEALGFAERAVALLEELVDGGDTGERVYLVASRRLHVKLLMAAGRRSAAADSLHRAVKLARELSEEDRAAHLRLLRNTLSDAGWVLYDVDPASAVTATAEHLALSEELDDPDGNRYDLAFALDVHAAALAELDRHEVALDHSARALPLWEALGNDADTAWCLVYRAPSLAAVGSLPEALAAAGRGLELLRAAYTEDAGQREYLAIALREHALVSAAADRAGEARGLMADAIEHFEALAEQARQVHLPELARTLFAAAVIDAGDQTALLRRAIAAHEELDAADPGVFGDKLAEALILAESIQKGES